MTAVWSTYVAVGDSFTEGMDDQVPGHAAGEPAYRGWADLLAAELAARTPDFAYANLAVRGKKMRQILAEQVPAAEAMRPALASLAGGTNDLLRPNVDMAAVAEAYEEAVARLAATGAHVVLFRGGLRAFPVLRPLRERLPFARERADFAVDLVDRVAATHPVTVVDLTDQPAFADRRMWSVDRLHLSSLGHERVAGAVLEALGLAAAGDWRTPMPPAPRRSPIDMVAADVHWTATHLVPWVGRRITGRSSGDGRVGKRPELVAYEPDQVTRRTATPGR